MGYMLTVVQAHGTIIETRTTCKKNLCYMLDAACRWLLLKKLKYFDVILNIFEFSRCEKM